jgi:hypothetical protein
MIKQRLKSKTHRAALAVSALGIVEVNMGLLQGILGDWYGVAFIGLAVVMHVLREVTTMPVDMKQ